MKISSFGNTKQETASAEDVHVKALQAIKENQEKALKAFEEKDRKAGKEKKESKERKSDQQPAITVSGGKAVEIGMTGSKGKPDKAGSVVNIPTEKGTGLSLIEIKDPNRKSQESDGSILRMANEKDKSIQRSSPSEGPPLKVDPFGEKQAEKRGFFERLFGKERVEPPTFMTAKPGSEITVPSETAGKKVSEQILEESADGTEWNAVKSSRKAKHEVATLSSFSHAPPERRDTLSHRVQSEMAQQRLKTESDIQEKAKPAVETKAEVVALDGAAAAATAAPAKLLAAGGASTPNAAKKSGDDEVSPATEEEIRAESEREYQVGLKSRDTLARTAAYNRAGAERREDAIPFLIEELKQNKLLAELAAQCLGAIGRQSDAVEQVLLAGLGNKESTVREACASALGRLKSRRASPMLVEKLKTEKVYQSRSAYLEALGQIGDKAALPALKERMNDRSEIEFVRTQAALALARFGEPSAREHLIKTFDSPIPALQVIGLNGLSRLNTPEAVGFLSAALESPNDEVWTTAVYLFPRLGPEAALPVLRSRIEASSEIVRRRAALAMGFLGSDEGLPYIDRAVRVGSLQERAMGCELLAQLGRSDRAPLLLEKLRDPHTSVRQIAAVGLTRLGAREALPALIEAARGSPAASELPPALRGAAPDPMERLVMLSCIRILHGEKEDLTFTTLPSGHDQNWPELDRAITGQQIELVKLYQVVDVLRSGKIPSGAVLKGPNGREALYREGEPVAAGFKLRDIGLPAEVKDKEKTPAYVILQRGDERVTLVAGRPPEVEIKKGKKGE